MYIYICVHLQDGIYGRVPLGDVVREPPRQAPLALLLSLLLVLSLLLLLSSSSSSSMYYMFVIIISSSSTPLAAFDILHPAAIVRLEFCL